MLGWNPKRKIGFLFAGSAACVTILASSIVVSSSANAKHADQTGSAAHATEQGVSEKFKQVVLAGLYDPEFDNEPPSGEFAIAQIGKTNQFVVYVRASGRCGSGGCRPEIWIKEGEDYRRKQSLTVSHLPLVQLPQTDHGMPRLGISVFDKNRGKMMILPIQFDGAEYAKLGRNLKAGSGRALISHDMLIPFDMSTPSLNRQ